jgi:hypothetical protein
VESRAPGYGDDFAAFMDGIVKATPVEAPPDILIT